MSSELMLRRREMMAKKDDGVILPMADFVQIDFTSTVDNYDLDVGYYAKGNDSNGLQGCILDGVAYSKSNITDGDPTKVRIATAGDHSFLTKVITPYSGSSYYFGIRSTQTRSYMRIPSGVTFGFKNTARMTVRNLDLLRGPWTPGGYYWCISPGVIRIPKGTLEQYAANTWWKNHVSKMVETNFITMEYPDAFKVVFDCEADTSKTITYSDAISRYILDGVETTPSSPVRAVTPTTSGEHVLYFWTSKSERLATDISIKYLRVPTYAKYWHTTFLYTSWTISRIDFMSILPPTMSNVFGSGFGNRTINVRVPVGCTAAYQAAFSNAHSWLSTNAVITETNDFRI